MLAVLLQLEVLIEAFRCVLLELLALELLLRLELRRVELEDESDRAVADSCVAEAARTASVACVERCLAAKNWNWWPRFKEARCESEVTEDAEARGCTKAYP